MDSTTTQQPLEIRRVPLDSLHLDPANARHHPDENLDAITGSLRRFGQAEPLVVQKSSGRIVGGNGRLVAMKKLGWTECDIVELDIDDLTATGLGIALNRSGSLAEWHPENLAKLLDQLRTEDALDGVGFDSADIDALLDELNVEVDPQDLDDDGPDEPPVNPVSRAGDLWLLGDHRILCGDSTNADDLARLMDGDTAKLYATDPPYCVQYTGNDRPVHDGKPSGKDWSHVYREVDIKDLGEFLTGVLGAALPHVAPNAPIYCWHAHVQQPTIARVFEEHDILLHQVLVWVKPVATFGRSFFRWRHEPCAFGWRRGNQPKHGAFSMESVWEVDWDGKKRVSGNEHPCLHPLARVLTSDGYRPISEIRPGDRVFAADAKFHAVTDVTCHDHEPEFLHRIRAIDAIESTEVTGNHPFLIWRADEDGPIHDGHAEWVAAEDIQINDWTMTPLADDPNQHIHVPNTAQNPFGLERVEHDGTLYELRRVCQIDRIPYDGDVWNLTVDGNPTFQTTIGMSHNTEKPTRIFEIPMELHTKPGDVVLETFSGSGSQLIAAEKLSRRCRAMELSPTFVDVAVKRWQRATGKAATLDGDGRTFDEITAERIPEGADDGATDDE